MRITPAVLTAVLIAAYATAAFAESTVESESAPTRAPVDVSKVSVDRVQMRDTGLSCDNIKAEVELMDQVDKAAGGGEAERGEMSNAATASAVGQVATGAAIQSGAFGALPLLGPLARLGTQVVMDQRTADAQDKAKRSNAAKARKEHLTELFIKRDCKL